MYTKDAVGICNNSSVKTVLRKVISKTANKCSRPQAYQFERTNTRHHKTFCALIKIVAVRTTCTSSRVCTPTVHEVYLRELQKTPLKTNFLKPRSSAYQTSNLSEVQPFGSIEAPYVS